MASVSSACDSIQSRALETLARPRHEIRLTSAISASATSTSIA